MDGNPLLDEFVLGLTQSERPKVCFLPSASGDADHYIVRFYRAFSPAKCEPSHVSLFRRDKGAGLGCDIATHLLSQDLIYVGGGSVISLLVLCGLSAGSLCWFADAVTAFHGPPQRIPCLGLLPYSNCVHYDGEPARRASYHQFLSDGMPPGYAASDGAALHFRGESLAGVVSSRPQATACWVEEVGGDISEVALPVRWLGESRTLTAA